MNGILIAMASALLMCACYDPVHLDAVVQLGPEEQGVRPGPTHRPGQPCTTCHGGEGPSESEFVVAGTTFTARGATSALVSATVTITDARGSTRAATSNAAGNFYITKKEWSPTFPLHVVLDAEGSHKEMVTSIGRDGGCATCHRGAGSASGMPGVFLRDK